jgi:hypothetical protein
MMTRDDISWHLDKKVPLGLILALLVQTVVITSWGSAKFENYEGRIMNLEKNDDAQQAYERRITVLEEKFNYIRDDLTEIKDLLQRGMPEKGKP